MSGKVPTPSFEIDLAAEVDFPAGRGGLPVSEWNKQIHGNLTSSQRKTVNLDDDDDDENYQFEWQKRHNN